MISKEMKEDIWLIGYRYGKLASSYDGEWNKREMTGGIRQFVRTGIQSHWLE